MDEADKSMTGRAKRLRDARVEAGVESASEAARQLGVNVATYSAHENGGRKYDVDEAQAYAKRFGVSWTWLLTGEGQSREEHRVTARGVPVVGQLDHTQWREKATDFDSPDNMQLYAVPLADAPHVWFAVMVQNTADWPTAAAGDYLICHRADRVGTGEFAIVERQGFDGKLWQLRACQCQEDVDGESHLVCNGEHVNVDELPSWKIIGKIESLYRKIV